MLDEALAVGFRRVVLRILQVRRSEDLLAPAPLAQFVRVVDCVARFVPQDLHAPFGRAPFDLEHLRLFEFLEPRVGEVEGNRDAGHAVGREPFVRQPEVRPEAEAAHLQVAIEFLDARLERAAFDRHAKLRHAQLEQFIVGPPGPFVRGYDARTGPGHERSSLTEDG